MEHLCGQKPRKMQFEIFELKRARYSIEQTNSDRKKKIVLPMNQRTRSKISKHSIETIACSHAGACQTKQPYIFYVICVKSRDFSTCAATRKLNFHSPPPDHHHQLFHTWPQTMRILKSQFSRASAREIKPRARFQLVNAKGAQ